MSQTQSTNQLQRRVSSAKERTNAVNAMMDANPRRSLNIQTITPVLQQKQQSTSELFRRRSEQAKAPKPPRPEQQANTMSSNRVIISPVREVFSTAVEKDLVSLSQREIDNVIANKGRPPRSGTGRRGPLRKDIIDGKRKKLAISRLMQDKALTSELIRIYSNNAELRESQRKLAMAVGSRPNSAKKTQVTLTHRKLNIRKPKNSATEIQPIEKLDVLPAAPRIGQHSTKNVN